MRDKNSLKLPQDAGTAHARCHAVIRLWQVAALLFLALSVLGAVGYFSVASRGLGVAIVVDGQTVAIVRDEDVADRVRQRIIDSAVGGRKCKAGIKERWVLRPPRLLSADEAFQELKRRVHVVVDAYAIKVDDKPVVYLPDRQLAQEVLDEVKRRLTPDVKGEIVREPTFRENVAIVEAQQPVDPSRVVWQLDEAVERLINPPRYHIVKKGDTPAAIARRYGISLKKLYALNPGLKGRDLRVGEKLVVGRGAPKVTVVTVLEVKKTEEVPPPTQKVPTAALPAGKTSVATEGEPGERRLTLHITYENGRRIKAKTVSATVIKLPKPRKVLVGTARPTPPAGPASPPRGQARPAGPDRTH